MTRMTPITNRIACRILHTEIQKMIMNVHDRHFIHDTGSDDHDDIFHLLFNFFIHN